MTTIIAKETEHGIEWGWDSKTSGGGGHYEGERRKVFRNGEIVFGFAGQVRGAEIIEYMDIPEMDKKIKGDEVNRWVTRVLIPAMRDALKEDERLNSNQGLSWMDNHIILAVRGRVYKIEENFGWSRRKDGIYSIGSGSHFALGALKSGASVKKALKVARYFDSSTGHTLESANNIDLLK